MTRRAKKSTVSKPVRGPASLDQSAAGSLAIYRNAFSGVNGQPKIPDGKAIMSVGSRVQVAAELNNIPSGDDLLHILLYPGATQGMVVWGDTGALSTRGFTGYQFNDHMTFNVAAPFNSASFTPGNIVNNDNINEWRLVSQGLKLSLLNTGEENDGWWECIRYKDSFKADEFGFYSGDNTNQQIKCVYGPDTTMKAKLAGKNLVNSPTYCSGALQDIDKAMFALQPQTEDHDFRKLASNYFVGATDANHVGGGANYVTLLKDTAQCHAIHDALVDPAFDAIYIRVHCRANSGSGATTGSRLLAHMVANHEVCYDEDQNEHKFMTRTSDASEAFSRENAKRRKFTHGATQGASGVVNPYKG